MSTTTFNPQAPAATSAPFTKREETNFGGLVKWFRYDSDINENKSTVEKVIKTFFGCLLLLVSFVLVIPFIFAVKEVAEQKADEQKNKEWQAFQKTLRPDDLIDKLEKKLSNKTIADLSGVSVEEIEKNPLTKEQLNDLCKKNGKLLEKLILTDGSNQVKIPSAEEKNAREQDLYRNASLIEELETMLANATNYLDSVKKELQEARKKSNNWNYLSVWTFGFFAKDPAIQQLDDLEKKTEKDVASLRQKLIDIHQNPTDIKKKLEEAQQKSEEMQESLLKLDQDSKAQIEQIKKEFSEKLQSSLQEKETLEKSVLDLNQQLSEVQGSYEQDKIELENFRKMMKSGNLGDNKEALQKIGELEKKLAKQEKLIERKERALEKFKKNSSLNVPPNQSSVIPQKKKLKVKIEEIPNDTSLEVD